MTSIRANRKGKTISLEVNGHAGYAKKGEDIVCAAVSALVQTMLYSLKEYEECKIREGYVYIVAKGEEACHLYEYTVTGLKLIAEAYPENVMLVDGCTIFSL